MKRSTIFGIVGLMMICTSAFALGNAYFRSLGVGGGFNSLGDGGASLASNGDILTNGKGTFLGGVDAFGGGMTAPIELLVEEEQVGLFTGGGSVDTGTLVFNGTVFVIDTSDYESPSGMGVVSTIEDIFGYGARPTLGLVGDDAEGLRLHYDLTSTVSADIFDDDTDTTLRLENSDAGHIANLDVEGFIEADTFLFSRGLIGSTRDNTGSDTGLLISAFKSAGGRTTRNVFAMSRGTAITPAASQDEDRIDFDFTARDDSGSETFASISVAIDGTPGTDDVPGSMTFKTTPDGSNTPVDALKLHPNQDATLTGDLEVVGNDINLGDVGGFSGVKFAPGTTTLDFYIDGVKVGHIGTDGAYTDDVP